jgi:hypothetical protein
MRWRFLDEQFTRNIGCCSTVLKSATGAPREEVRYNAVWQVG